MSLPKAIRPHDSLARFAWLSIGAAIATMLLKALAYFATGSVGLLSDAMESFVNLVGGVMALGMLRIAARPADDNHPYGHNKAEYFSSGLEGSLILAAAGAIAWQSGVRLLDPQPLAQIGVGFVLSMGASVLNLVTALILRQAAKAHRSIVLEASAHHLMTDVWTSIGVLGGVGAVAATGWLRVDPLVALLVAGNITWVGFRVVRKSVIGLMDTTLPTRDLDKVRQALDAYVTEDVEYHALWTRRSGTRSFVSLHVLVPGHWTVQRGHELCEHIEADVRAVLDNVTVFTHLEPLNDPASFEDLHLDRRALGE